MHIKTVRVTNSKNVLVQIPGFSVKKWGLREGNEIDVSISADEESIIIKPRKQNIQPRIRLNRESGGLSG